MNLKNSSHSQHVDLSYLPTKGIFSGDNALLCNKLQLPRHLGHTTGSPSRSVVSGGPRRILTLKRKLKEHSVAGLLGIISKSINSPSVSSTYPIEGSATQCKGIQQNTLGITNFRKIELFHL